MPDFNSLLARARKRPGVVVLPEGEDLRVLNAARLAADAATAKPVLLGDDTKIKALAKQHGISLADLELINPITSELREPLQNKLLAARQHKGMTSETAAENIVDTLHFACMMVREGFAAGCVAGAVYPKFICIELFYHAYGTGTPPYKRHCFVCRLCANDKSE